MTFIASPESWAHFVTALLHTLWQGALSAAALFLLLRVIPARRVRLRYGLSLAALFGIVLAGHLTWGVLSHEAASLAMTATEVEESAGQLPEVETPSGSVAPKVMPAGPATRPPLADAPMLPWVLWAARFWMAGVCVMLLRLGRSVLRVHRICRNATEIADENIHRELRQFQSVYGLGRRICLKVADGLLSPAVVGISWPTVLLPVSLATNIPVEQLRAVLAHEMAHIRRYDYLVNLVQMFIEALLFFNPAVWWISRQVRTEREACCDLLAEGALDGSVDYPDVLADIAERLRPAGGVQAPAQAMQSGAAGLLSRIRRLAFEDVPSAPQLAWHSFLTVLVIAAMTLCLIGTGVFRGVALAVEWVEHEKRVAEHERVKEAHKLWSYSERIKEERVHISGEVLLSDGTPASADTKLKIQGVSKAELTDGRFEVKDAHFSPEYRLVASAPGYAPAFAGPYEAEPGGELSNLRLILEKGFPAKFKVVDANDKPVPDATIHGFYDHPLRPKIGPFEPSGDGIATLRHAANITAIIAARAAGYEFEEFNVRPSPDEVLVLELTPTDTATGQVVRKTDGEPVSEATIRVICLYGKWGRIRMLGDSGGCFPEGELDQMPQIVEFPEAVTDQDGRFQFPSLRKDTRYLAEVRAPGLASVLLEGLATGKAGIRVEMPQSIRIRGTVRGAIDELREQLQRKDRYGRALCIRAIWSPINLHLHYLDQWFFAPVTFREREGQFALRDLRPGYYTIEYQLKRLNMKVTQSIDDLVIEMAEEDLFREVGPLATRPVAIRFEKSEASPPIEGSIVLNGIYANGQRWRRKKFKPFKIVDGSVEVAAPSGGRLEVQNVDIPGYRAVHQRRIEVPEGKETLVISIPLEPAGAIYGKLIEADGSPTRKGATFLRKVKSSGETDSENGSTNSIGGHLPRHTFVKEPLSLDTKYQVIGVSGASFVESEVIRLTRSDPFHEVELRFPKGVPIRGKVLMPDGTPARLLTIELRYRRGKDFYVRPTAMTDEKGEFQFEGVNPDASGAYQIHIEGRWKEYRYVSEMVGPGEYKQIQLETD